MDEKTYGRKRFGGVLAVILLVGALRAEARTDYQAGNVRPEVAYANLLESGAGNLAGTSIGVDAAGNAYITGVTAQQQQLGTGRTDVFVLKLAAQSGDPVWAVNFGGSQGDAATGIAVDSSGQVYVVGVTSSPDFPVRNAFQARRKGVQNAFVVKLSGDSGELLFSTFLGGSGGDSARGVAVDSSGDVYVVGATTSTDFPTTSECAQRRFANGGFDAFVAKLEADGSGLSYSCYVGGRGYDLAFGVAVNNRGEAVVVGVTASDDFPGAMPGSLRGVDDGFVVRLNSSGAGLTYSKLLGGSGSEALWAAALDGTGNAHVAGVTTSTNLPLVGAFQSELRGGQDAFIGKLSPEGAPLQVSYLGGSGGEVAKGVAADDDSNTLVTCITTSGELLGATGGLLGNRSCNQSGGILRCADSFIVRISAGDRPDVTTFLGGAGELFRVSQSQAIAVDRLGNAYLTGVSTWSDGPGSAVSNGFVAKIAFPRQFRKPEREGETVQLAAGAEESPVRPDVDENKALNLTGQPRAINDQWN